MYIFRNLSDSCFTFGVVVCHVLADGGFASRGVKRRKKKSRWSSEPSVDIAPPGVAPLSMMAAPGLGPAATMAMPGQAGALQAPGMVLNPTLGQCELLSVSLKCMFS